LVGQQALVPARPERVLQVQMDLLPAPVRRALVRRGPQLERPARARKDRRLGRQEPGLARVPQVDQRALAPQGLVPGPLVLEQAALLLVQEPRCRPPG
jgi:hypothetical protein